jgi:hypothetical protein
MITTLREQGRPNARNHRTIADTIRSWRAIDSYRRRNEVSRAA